MIDRNKLIALGGLALVVGLLLCGVFTAGCIDDDKTSLPTEVRFPSDLDYYYIPSIDKYISSADPDYDKYVEQYGSDMGLLYRSFKIES